MSVKFRIEVFKDGKLVTAKFDVRVTEHSQSRAAFRLAFWWTGKIWCPNLDRPKGIHRNATRYTQGTDEGRHCHVRGFVERGLER